MTPEYYIKRYGLPSRTGDLQFPSKTVMETDASGKTHFYMKARARTPEEYIAEFNRLNHLKE